MECLFDTKEKSNISSQISEGIELQPLVHQVAGRATIMCLNESTVCKPLNFREKYFYQSLPPHMHKFTAKFKGVVNVEIEEGKDGTVALTAIPPSGENDTDKNNEVFQTEHYFTQKRIKLSRSGNLCLDPAEGHLSDIDLHHLQINPWTAKVYRDSLRRQLKSQQKVVQKCILLENVTGRFKFPCILDLKMGTRVHGDFDDDAKRKRQLKKCESTTSQTLGMRLGGMQVYQSSADVFVCRDKYFGRTLNDESLKSTIRMFFCNGKTLRRQALFPIMHKIKKLEKSLMKLSSYRFYSSSLLVMYDAVIDFDEDAKLCPKSYLDVRMIDFAKSTHSNMNHPVVHQGPDNGYLFGLRSLKQVINEMLEEDQNV